MGLNKVAWLRKACAALLALALVVPAGPVQAAPAELADNREDARLLALLRDFARRQDALDPMSAIQRGGEPDPATFALLHTAALTGKVRAANAASLSALKRIDRRRLSPERQISYDVFLHEQREAAETLLPDNLAFTTVRPLNHFAGLHVEFPALVMKDGPLRYHDAADYRRNLALIRAFPQVLDNAAMRFRDGLASGVLETQLTTRNMIGQIDALLAQPADESVLLSPIRSFPPTVSEPERAELREAWVAAVDSEVIPAYRRLRAFLADEYLPAARASIGLAQMKGGPALYRRLIRQHTTLALDPDDVHRLGLAEVARIQREMTGVKAELGFSGTLPAFFEHIRRDPRFHPKTRTELADGFAAVARKVDALVPQYFTRLPRTKLLIEAYPAYRERYEAGGSYNPGSPDGTRPGVFHYNAYDLPSRFLTGVATLYLHEGAPGHHFQISLAQENTSLPDFQRFGGNNAYVEGWALYAETLGFEMGFYRDPLQHWGTLDDEMLRAMRLVVDTGIHAKGWSRDQAVTYMLANSGMGRTDAAAEVERYVAIPGQALSYKIGALTIQRLRREAETALGSKFDIKAFHTQVLGSGALPLPVLEAKVRRWIGAGG